MKLKVFRESFVREGQKPVLVKILGKAKDRPYHGVVNGHNRYYYHSEVNGEKKTLSVGQIAHEVIENNLPLTDQFFLEKQGVHTVCRPADDPEETADIPVVLPGGDIKQTNQLYVALREIGMLDQQGKRTLWMDFKGRIASKPDKPMVTLVWPLVNELLKYCRYTSDEAALADIEQFKRIIASLKYE